MAAKRVAEIGKCRQEIGKLSTVAISGRGDLTLQDLEGLLENSIFMTAFYRLFDHYEDSGKLPISEWLKIMHVNLGYCVLQKYLKGVFHNLCRRFGYIASPP